MNTTTEQNRLFYYLDQNGNIKETSPLEQCHYLTLVVSDKETEIQELKAKVSLRNHWLIITTMAALISLTVAFAALATTTP